jgi:hypothetical protein
MTLACLMAVVVLLVAAAPARASAGGVDWTDTWNTSKPGDVYAARAAARPGGGVYVAASLRRPSGNLDIAILRYAANRTRAWVRYYDGAAHGVDLVKGIAVDRRGNVVICGSSRSATGKQDWVVLKYGADGRRHWVRKLAGSFGGADVPQAIAVDAAGNVVVVGSLTQPGTGADWCVAKLSPRGVPLWRTTMSRFVSGFDQALDVVIDPATAHIYVTGRMYASSTGDDAVTVRYRPDGQRVWRRLWDGAESGPDRGVSIALSKRGVAVAGVSGSPDSGDDGLVLSYAKNGTPRWAKVVDGGQGAAGVDRFTAVGIDDSGNVVAGGCVTTSAAQGKDLALVRFRASGTQGGWWQPPGADADDAALDVSVTPGGRTYAVGTSTGDAVVAGLSADLSPLWPVVTYDRAGGDDLAQSVSLSTGAVYVAGVSGADLLLMKIAR